MARHRLWLVPSGQYPLDSCAYTSPGRESWATMALARNQDGVSISCRNITVAIDFFRVFQLWVLDYVFQAIESYWHCHWPWTLAESRDTCVSLDITGTSSAINQSVIAGYLPSLSFRPLVACLWSRSLVSLVDTAMSGSFTVVRLGVDVRLSVLM